MKITQKLEIKTKDDLLSTLKQKKILPFFRVYQKFVQLNVVNPFIYIIILVIEYVQLFYELTNNFEDYIKNPSEEAKSTTSFEFFKVLQYLNFSHFISPNYLSYHNFVIIYIITIVVLGFNFFFLLILDYIDKTNNQNNKIRFKILHIVIGVFNYINIKILIIPTSFVLIRSFSINSFFESNSVGGNPTSGNNLVNSLSNMRNGSGISGFASAVIMIFSLIIMLINLYTMINTTLLFNDIDPIEMKLCWAQSYPEIEMYNIGLKVSLVIFNHLGRGFLFFKSIFILVINLQRCSFRFLEWYYAWSMNQILLVVLDFAFLFYNFVSFVSEDLIKSFDSLVICLIIAVVFGLLMRFVVVLYQRRILIKNIHEFKSEREFASLIIQIIQLIQKLQNDKKSINDPLFFGFLKQHKKICKNPNCFANISDNLVYTSKSKFVNEIESFELHKTEFNLYCKANKKNTFEILPDLAKSRCEKVLYSLITCIVSFGMKNLKKDQVRLLPILEAYVYIHIFNNQFYALFQIMKFYKPSVHYREKFYYFLSLCEVLEKMYDENNTKFTPMASISSVTDYYYYHEIFISVLLSALSKSEKLFFNLIKMKPMSHDVLSMSNNIGNDVQTLYDTFSKIMFYNPYEINDLRIYSFILDKVFLMKKSASQQRSRLSQNIKYFLLNDKFKNVYDNNNSKSSNKSMSIKNFQENSDSGVVIISGNLENLGTILYANNNIESILGFSPSELVSSSLNRILPEPLCNEHNKIILNFYKTGKRHALDRVSNVITLHKNGFLVSIDLYVCCLPNMEHGLMFVAFLKNSYWFRFLIKTDFDKSVMTTSITENTNINNNPNISDNEGVFGNLKKVEGNDFKFDSSEDEKPSSHILIAKKGTKTDTTFTQNEQNFPKKSQSQANFKTMIYKVKETGIIFLTKRYEILHANSVALCHFMGLLKPFPPRKVHIIKICKEIYIKKSELENGETINVGFDVLNIQNLFSGKEGLVDMEKIKKRASFISITKLKNVKVTMTRINLPSSNDYYYILIISSNRKNEDESTTSSITNKSSLDSDSDNSLQFNENNKTKNSFSQIGNFDVDAIETTKEQKVEKLKRNLLNNKYTPRFTKITNILIICLIMMIVIWVIISYIVELSELHIVKSDLKLLNINENLKNVIGYYIINSLMLVRANFFAFSNSRVFLPLIRIEEVMDRQNMYTLMNYISNDFLSSQSDVFRRKISQNNISFSEKNLENTTSTEYVNLEIALKKIIYYLDYLKNFNNFKNISEDEFFDAKTTNNLVKTKLYYIYFNYFDNIHDQLKNFSLELRDVIENDIINKRNTVLILICICILFALAVCATIIVRFTKSERYKKGYLSFLANCYDLFYEERVRLLKLTEFNIALLSKEDMNIHKVKNKLEYNKDFKDEFIIGSDFLIKTKVLNMNLDENEELSELRRTMDNSSANSELIERFEDGKYFQKTNSIRSNITLGNKSNQFANKTSTNIVGEDEGEKEKPADHVSMNVTNTDSRFKKNVTLGSKGLKKEQTNQLILNNENEFIQNVTTTGNVFLLNQGNNESLEEEDLNDEDRIKAYTNYKISLSHYLIEILLSFIIMNSFFILSIVYLFSYFEEIKRIIYNEILLNDRVNSVNNLLIAINLVLLYNSEEPLGSKRTMRDIINEINTIEDSFRGILSNMTENSNVYHTLTSYDTEPPCSFYNGFNNYFNLITCEEFMSDNGLTFEVSQIYNYVNLLFDDFNDRGRTNETYRRYLFTDPEIVRNMIKNIFILRLFFTDITSTHTLTYLESFDMMLQIIHLKFYLYMIVLFIFYIVLQGYVLTKQKNEISNLTRVKVFFEDTCFKSSIS